MQFLQFAAFISICHAALAPPSVLALGEEELSTLTKQVAQALKSDGEAVAAAASGARDLTYAEHVLINNPEFAEKFGIKAKMTPEEMRKKMNRAILRTRIGNGAVGGVVGAGAGITYEKFQNWKKKTKENMQKFKDANGTPFDGSAAPGGVESLPGKTIPPPASGASSGASSGKVEAIPPTQPIQLN